MAGVPVLIFTLPTAVVNVGKQGPFQSPQMGAAFSGYSFQLTPGVGYPTVGAALDVLIERNQGAGWLNDAEVTFGPGPQGVPMIFQPDIGTIGPPESPIILTTAPTDLYRVTLNALQNCGAPVFKLFGIS